MIKVACGGHVKLRVHIHQLLLEALHLESTLPQIVKHAHVASTISADQIRPPTKAAYEHGMHAYKVCTMLLKNVLTLMLLNWRWIDHFVLLVCLFQQFN